jgi:hypothetical protein
MADWRGHSKTAAGRFWPPERSDFLWPRRIGRGIARADAI